MRKLYILLCCLLPLASVAQSTKTFECADFSFEYPESFSPIKIRDTSRVVLKLQSKYYELIVSSAKSGWPKDKNIWDDDVRERFINNYSGSGKIVSITKEIAQIKDDTAHCLKIMLNSHKQIDNSELILKSVIYLFFNNGNLCMFTFGSKGEYSKGSPTTYPDKVMKGLKLKKRSTTEDDASTLNRMIFESINEVYPIRVDDCFTILQVSLIENTITYKVQMDNSCEGRVDINAFKEEMIYYFSIVLEKSFFQNLDKNGCSITYLIYNENEQLRKTITLNPKEILTYYQ